MMRVFLYLFAALLTFTHDQCVLGFSVGPQKRTSIVQWTPSPTTVVQAGRQRRYSSELQSKTKKATIDESVKNKLLAETIAPWRALRLFAYSALGGGALIGFVVTLTSTAAVFAGARTDLDLNTCLTNLAINLGGVVGFAFLAKLDLEKKAELDQRVEEKVEKKKELKKLQQGMLEREKALGNLMLDIQISADGATREAAVKDLQMGAKQHMIVVIGPKKACRDALIGASLLKMDFAISNILVVPYETDGDLQARSTGFGERPKYETQAYVAKPSGDLLAWRQTMEAEMKVAVEQNGEKAKEEGIVLVVANTGKIIRRGVGKIPWRQVVEELEQVGKKE